MSIVDKILTEARLNELFDSNQIYDFDFKTTSSGSAMASFVDEAKNRVNVTMQKVPGRESAYEVNYYVNGKIDVNKDGAKASMSQYMKIMNTVFAAVSKLVAEFNPEQIIFSAVNEGSNAYSQRFKIYSLLSRKLSPMYNQMSMTAGGSSKMVLVRKDIQQNQAA